MRLTAAQVQPRKDAYREIKAALRLFMEWQQAAS